MWWGGSEGGQGGSPPPDPPVEQGDSSQAGEDVAVVRQELGDLKDQFDEQQALIGQLKDMLKKKEVTLSSREKEVQDYASRLARMKPRLGRRVKQSSGPSEQSESGESSEAVGALATGDGSEASAFPPSAASAEASPSPPPPAEASPSPPPSAPAEASSSLPSAPAEASSSPPLPSAPAEVSPYPPLSAAPAEERLSAPLPGEVIVIPAIPVEGRVIEEKKLSSSESSSRAKILLLRKQLQENRLKFQRQQKDDEKLAVEEMKQRIDRLRTDVEQRDDIIQSLQEGKGSFHKEPSMQKLYQQIVYKDNTILDLSQKLTHLEGVIQDQQESLSEKDKVIEARTEAVSLVAKAQDEKGLKTLEELEEVRYQMKKMQGDFISKEQEMVAEKEALSRELKDKIKKVNQLEDNGRRLENLRFEMSARNAELQEKIVGLQSDGKALREQSEVERQSYLEKDSTLQELKQKLVRAEAHGQRKMKALEKQLRSIKQDGNAGEKILELQNAIAELEEEKGNLQLKLVDFDDLKAMNEKITIMRNKLEDHVKQLNCDLDSQLSAITQLETEKIKLVEGVNERENRIFDLESEMSGLKTNLEEIMQAKVTLDLRVCEVEEQRDTAEKTRVDLENQMSEAGRAPVEQLMAEKGSLEESMQSIMKERDEWEQKYLGQIEMVEECEKNAKSAIEEKDKKARECKRLMNILTDKENAIATLSIQIDKNDAVVARVEDKLMVANSETEKLQLEVTNLNQNLQDYLQRLQAAHNTITEMEDRLTASAAELQSREKELTNLQGNIETLNRSVNERNITVQNLVGEVSGLQEQVRQKERSVNDHIDRLEDLESQINSRDTDIEQLCSTIVNKDELISAKNVELESMKKDLLNSSKQLEMTKSSLECELDALSAMFNDSKNQLESSQMNLEVKDREIQNNQDIISKYEQEVCDRNRTLNELQIHCQDLQAKLSFASSSLAQKEATISKLENEIEEKILSIENLQKQQSSLEQKVLHQAEENKSIMEEKSRIEEELSESLISTESLRNTLSEKMEYISNLEASVGNYTSEVESKASEVEKWQHEALEKSEQLDAVTRQLEYIQSDSGSKDTLVADLQAQLAQKQEHISELGSRLQQAEGQFSESQQNFNRIQEQLTLTHNQLTQTQEQYTKLQEELAMSHSQLTDTNTQYERVTALAVQFEEQLRAKSTNLDTAEKQMASQEESSILELDTARRDVKHLRSEVTRLETELQASKEQVEASQIQSSQLQEHTRQIQEDLENMRVAQETYCQQSEITKQELDLKCQEVLQWQQSLSEHQSKANSLQEELTQAISYQQQYQQQANSLQEELNQAFSLKQQNESEIAALSITQQQKISQLEGELLSLNQAKDHLQAEFEKSNIELQSQLQQSLSEHQSKANSLQEELTQAISYQQQYQQQANSLQEELNQAFSLKQQNESEIAALSVTQQQRISQLEGELVSLNQARDHLQAEFEKSNVELQSQLHIVNELKVNLESLTSQAFEKDAEIQTLQNKVSDYLQSEEELKNLVGKLQEEKTQLSAEVLKSESMGPDHEGVVPAVSDSEVLSAEVMKSESMGPDHEDVIPAVSDSEVTSLTEELAKALDQSKFLEEECDGLRGDANTLKQQLQDARQTITHLQTSLATQPQSSTTASGWDDWGEVDLGAPAPMPAEVPLQARSLVSSLQKSLSDKDEMLTVMQEQLKETLEEINTINEERKILEQQRQSAEASAAQQMEKLKEENEELGRWKIEVESSASLQVALEQEKERIASLEQDLIQKQQVIEGLNQQLLQMQMYQQPQVQGTLQLSAQVEPAVVSETAGVIEEEIVTSQVQETHQEGNSLFATAQWPQSGVEQDPASWFNQQVDVKETPVASGDQVAPAQNLGIDPNQLQAQDPASWFDQPHVSADTQAVSEEVTAAQSYEQQGPSQVPQEQESINVEELQYKLSWYEEQWSTWTSHYNLLQTSYQESEERVAELSQQLQALQVVSTEEEETKDEMTVSGDAGAAEEESKPAAQEGASETSSVQAQEIQSQLVNAEVALEQLREENRLLQLEANQVVELRAQLERLRETADDPTRLQNAEAEVNQLRGFETQVYELQSQVQALQHQCTAMQNKLSESETEVSRLREVEVLYGEVQSCIQESETKREGSTSRVQELELMVQSAESEIARLRNEIEVLNQAEQTAGLNREGLQGEEVSEINDQVLRLQSEVDRYQKEASLFKDEVDKYQNESYCCKAEMARLENENQNMGDEMARARSDLQRMELENSQLRSELEVFEGELDRMRTACEMYEAENNRTRGDYEALSQATQMTEAEKESLESEVQRITAQNMTLSADGEHLRDEIQRLTEVSTSAETEIARLQTEMERFKSLDYQYTDLESKYNELQSQVASMESTQDSKISESDPHSLVVEEVDWSAEGRIEDEHRQRSSSVDLKYQGEIDNLKENVIALEKEKNGIYDELQAAKMKSGKMLQKLKLAQSKNETLTKEIQKLKAKAGGFSDLDQALEEEWRAQVAKAESERDEFKQKLDEVENEKENLVTQVDVLTAAQDEFIELKEDQDTNIKLLKSRNKEVEGQVQALEWRISELEEAVEQQSGTGVQESMITPRTSPEREGAPSSTEHQVTAKEVEALKAQISSLHDEIKILKSENERLQTSSKELEEAVENLSNENETFQSVIENLKEAKTKAENDTSNYKSVYIELNDEHESIKKEKEKTNEELRELTYTHDTLKAAYNSLYADYNDVRDVCDSHKHDVGILKGERDRLVEEINSLKNQLQALHEEEEEETIRALQDECFSLREQNNLIHEENTVMEVKSEDALEKAARTEHTLEQNIEMQKLLQEELLKKSEEISFHTTTIEGQERQMTYLKAEMAALKTKLLQQDQAEDNTLETTQELEMKVEQLQEQNEQLQIQVGAAEASLALLAGGNRESSDAAFTPAAPSTTELEAAFASLHLRDLRCQQLSLEITKLLEERDALQLKLSASLRQTQELTRELSLSHQLPAPVAPEPSLDQKLAELRELNDSLEQRALVSLHGAASAGMGRRITIGGLQSPPIFTPHTAPPTPTATRHADYTLKVSSAREAQGTSTTLIDWIMGKSTPRVLHV